jgi:hypothetical protein
MGAQGGWQIHHPHHHGSLLEVLPLHPLGHPYTTETVAKLFFAEIVWLHDIPQSLVSNCDPMFTSTFWKEILTLSSAKLHMTMALHPQAEGQVEAANKVITMYLRCFTRD